MDQLFSTLKKPAALLAIVLLLTAAVCMLLVSAGGFDSGFFPVIGDLLLLVFYVALYAVVAVLLLMKKNDLAEKALAPVFAWWLLNSVASGLSRSAFIDSRYEGLFVTVCVFSFLAALVLLASAVFFILGICGKTALYKFGWLLFAAYLCLSFIVMVMTCVYAGVNDFGWQNFIDALGDLALAAGLFFAGLSAWYRPAAAAAEEPAAIEAPAEEPQAIEAPAGTDSKTED